MKLEYDSAHDIAYMDLDDAGKPVNFTVPVRVTEGTLNFDFDAKGQLVGIEALPASKLLPPSLLKTSTLVSLLLVWAAIALAACGDTAYPTRPSPTPTIHPTYIEEHCVTVPFPAPPAEPSRAKLVCEGGEQ